MSAAICAVFVFGLTDVRLGTLGGPVPVELPAPPLDVADRDGELTVQVVEAYDAPTEAGSEAGVGTRDGPPIAGARVRVLWGRDGRYFLAGDGRTDAAGAVTLKKLPRGEIWVTVDAENWARSSTTLVIGAEPRTAKVRLRAAESLSVLVKDGEGNPLPLATVLVTGGDPLPFGALTDGAGLAAFDRVGPSPWVVKASARGYESVTRSGVDGDVEIVLRELGSLEVKVVDEGGAPVGGASVSIVGSSLFPARRTETDKTGVSRIAGLLGGVYDLRAVHERSVSQTVIGYRLDKGEHAQVTLRLMPGRMVMALVTEGADDPAPIVVSGADVMLTESGISSFPLYGRTGPDGTVTLGPIAEGHATLAARARGFVARAAVSVPEELPDSPIRIPLLKGGDAGGAGDRRQR